MWYWCKTLLIYVLYIIFLKQITYLGICSESYIYSLSITESCVYSWVWVWYMILESWETTLSFSKSCPDDIFFHFSNFMLIWLFSGFLKVQSTHNLQCFQQWRFNICIFGMSWLTFFYQLFWSLSQQKHTYKITQMGSANQKIMYGVKMKSYLCC